MQIRKALEAQAHATTRPPAWRRDYAMASAIERGLALQVAAGISVAAQYMYERGVPFEIVHRTLIAGVHRTNDLGTPTPFGPRRYVMPTPLMYSHSHPGPQYLRSRQFHAALKTRQRASMPDARANKAMAAAIDAGVAICSALCRRAAVAYMSKHRVPFKVIVRVLAGPQTRRGAGGRT